jgi:hypothetical protein
MGVGACRAGLTSCEDGFWGACDGEVVSVVETCDGVDDDCDGSVDEGLLNDCRTCGDCQITCAGPEPECRGWGDGQSGLVETTEGWLSLDADAFGRHVVWPSSTTGTIFRVDTRTYEILGAYRTGANGAEDSPSRAGVDGEGSVVIANRAWNVQGTITKIAADEGLCIDRNGNGRIETSTGWDDVLPFTSDDDWTDECILWHTRVGGVGSIPRAIALHQVVGLDGEVEQLGWVGLFEDERMVEFDVVTGELTGREAATPGFTPYSCAIDREGVLWLGHAAIGAGVGRFDTADPDGTWSPLHFPDVTPLRVIVDEYDAPWLSGIGGASAGAVWRWNRDAERFDAVSLVPLGGEPDTMVAGFTTDGRGSVWIGVLASDEWVYRITNAPGTAGDLDNHAIRTPGVEAFGVSADFDGHAWTFGFGTSNAAVIDLDTEEVEIALDDCGGAYCLQSPYVRGDVTGMQWHNLFGRAGSWSMVAEGCAQGGTDWTALVIDGLAPPGASFEVSARTAETDEGLAQQEWIPVGTIPPEEGLLDIDAAFGAVEIGDARFLAVQIVLRATGAESPMLQHVEVQYACERLTD